MPEQLEHSGIRAVADVSFSIKPGETLAIIGPNGSGKTTTINLISGLLAPDAGSVLLGTEELAGRGMVRAAEAGISRTFQNGRVFGSLTVAENVQLGLHKTLKFNRPGRALAHTPVLRWGSLLRELGVGLVSGRRAWGEMNHGRKKIDDEIARFGDRLAGREHHQAYTLSYANRRRTEIARALVSKPKLLLLDEPTAGMNQSETAQVLEQLLELKARGQTMLLVEHKIDLVLALADRLLVMNEGRVIAAGDPHEVRNDPLVVEAYLGKRSLSVSDRGTESRPVVGAELLKLDKVSVNYGPVPALRDVSISVRQGEIVSLLGGNASGKSTTMKTVLGLVEPRSGSLEFDGRALRGVPTNKRVASGIASVPEARRVFSQMTVTENLLAGAYTRKDRSAVTADVERVFEHFPRLAERRNQLAGTMSGGEQQMLAFGRALMSNPRLICMDEPTMGLSPKLVEQVLAEIARLRAELGISVLIVEQQAELALSIADRGYVLSNGEIVLTGTASDLLANDAVQEAYLGKGKPSL
jgi:ABC-type branched-subunit amino acid transport system ATPase component